MTNGQRHPVRRRWLAIGGAAAVVVALAAALAPSWLAHVLADRLAARLDGSGVTVTWTALDVGVTGRVTLQGLQVRHGDRTLLRCAAVEASLAWGALLRGRLRPAALDVRAPVVELTVADGEPLGWRDALAWWRQTRGGPDDDPGDPPSAGARTLGLHVRDGQLHVRWLGPLVFVLGLEHTIDDISVALADGEGTMAARLPPSLGGGRWQSTLRRDADGRPAMDGAFTPALRWEPPADLAARLPWPMALRVDGARASRAGAALTGVSVLDVGLPDAPTAIVTAAAVAVTGPEGVTATDVVAQVTSRHLQVLADRAGVTLAEGVLASQAIGFRAGRIEARRQPAKALSVHDVTTSYGSVHVGAAALRVALPVGERPELDVEAPTLRLPLAWLQAQLPASKALWEAGAAVAEGRDDQDELGAAPSRAPGKGHGKRKGKASGNAGREGSGRPASPTGAPAVGPRSAAGASAAGASPGATAAAVTPAKPSAAPGLPPGAPPFRWRRTLQAAHARVRKVPAELDRAWEHVQRLQAVRWQVRGGRVALTDGAGAEVVGARAIDASTRGEAAEATLLLALEPFGPGGASWGALQAMWSRASAGRHHIDGDLRGAGLARALAAALPGATAGKGAGIRVHATLTTDPKTGVTVAGDLDLDRVGLHWWRVSTLPIVDFSLRAPFRLAVDRQGLTLRADSIDISGARLAASLQIRAIDTRPRIHVAVQAPVQDCAVLLRAIPPSLTPTIGRIDASGELGFDVTLTTQLPQVGVTAVTLALDDARCRVSKLGAIDFAEFDRPRWQRPVNENGVLLEDVQVGPGSGSWTPLAALPRHVSFAMWATEDSFFKHRGLSESLLGKALAIDLSSGRFVYGGSTVTQQLVKNLYLQRTKALARKFEEMLITWQIERVLGKHRILELYVNVVEFGPKIYGITRAAWEFYQKTPGQLTPKEAVYLGIIKPSPRSGWGTMRANGWGEWYEMKTAKYMDKMLEDEVITPEQYEADKPWKPDFRPAPRQPARPGKAPSRR